MFVVICNAARPGAVGAGLGAAGAGLGVGLGLADGALCGAVALLGGVAYFGDTRPVQPTRQSKASGRIMLQRIPRSSEGRPTATRPLPGRRTLTASGLVYTERGNAYC